MFRRGSYHELSKLFHMLVMILLVVSSAGVVSANSEPFVGRIKVGAEPAVVGGTPSVGSKRVFHTWLQ